MGTDFSDIYGKVISRTKLKTTSDATLAKGYVNDRYLLLANKYPWSWMYEKATLVTTAKYDTGTVTATEGSTTITGDGTTFTAAMVGRKFKTDGFEEIYLVSAYVSATEITLDNEYNGDTSDELGFEIFQDLISLPSDMHTIVAIRQHRTPKKLDVIGLRELLRLVPDPSIQDCDPRVYAHYEPDSSGYEQIMLYPAPYRQMILDLEYKKQITELTLDADEPLIPEPYRQILVWGAMADVYSCKKNDPRWQLMENKYLVMVNEMLGKYKNADDGMRLIPENKRYNRLDLQELINQGYDLKEHFDRW